MNEELKTNPLLNEPGLDAEQSQKAAKHYKEWSKAREAAEYSARELRDPVTYLLPPPPLGAVISGIDHGMNIYNMRKHRKASQALKDANLAAYEAQAVKDAHAAGHEIDFGRSHNEQKDV